MVTSRGRVRGIIANTRSRGVAPAPPADILPVGVSSTAWTAGLNTTMTFPTSTTVRCASSNGNNPRVVKQLSGLTIGVPYRVELNVTLVTANYVYFRVSNDPAIGSSYAGADWGAPPSRDLVIDFTPDQTTCYLGFVPVVNIAGEYADGSKFIKVTKL